MRYQQTTQVPNEILDTFLPVLKEAELKLLLVIIRQTFGWRKKKDRISHSQLIQKTGLAKRTITEGLTSLCEKDIIQVTDFEHNVLKKSLERKGKYFLFYSYIGDANGEKNNNQRKSEPQLGQNPEDNKTIVTKLTEQNFVKEQGTRKLNDTERISQILARRQEES